MGWLFSFYYDPKRIHSSLDNWSDAPVLRWHSQSFCRLFWLLTDHLLERILGLFTKLFRPTKELFSRVKVGLFIAGGE